MPDLYHSLLGHDLGHLRIVAGLWGIELNSSDADSATKELAASLHNPEPAGELISSLPSEARAALTALVNAGGRLPWATFVRQFGEMREMGAGKRDRERPHLKPASTAEALFYRALLGRAFFDTPGGPQEFAYIPDELLGLVRRGEGGEKMGRDSVVEESIGRAATPAEYAHIVPANDDLLDDATTLLAELRLGHETSPDPKLPTLLTAAGLLKKDIPQTEAVKSFLESSRDEALKMLVGAWKQSEAFNELRLMPGLICEGEWKNRPRATREFLLSSLGTVPQGKWWSIDSLVSDIRRKLPDFQRPAGDYDSWFVKRASDGTYLRGFGAWDEVDGALIRFFLTDILPWFGMLDLARAKPDGEITAFRVRTPASRKSALENGRLKISSTGKVIAPRRVPRAVRYQLARFCEWDHVGRVAAGSPWPSPQGRRYTPSGIPDRQRRTETKAGEYSYRITPQSLAQAKAQGLKVEHLLALLARHADAGIPPALVKALKRWEVNGTEARAETQVVLRVSRPEVLEELRKSKAARFLGEPLGPTAVVIKAGAQSKVMAALAELGLLAEDSTTKDTKEHNGN